jgi:hypothetical protein
MASTGFMLMFGWERCGPIRRYSRDPNDRL